MEILIFIAWSLACLAGLLALWIVCVCLALTVIRFNHWAARAERRMRNTARRIA